jgi:hypothetical protein
VTERDRVDEGFTVCRRIPIDVADQDPEFGSRERGDPIEQREVQIDEARMRQQVARRITGGGELAEDHEIRVGRLCLRHGVGDFA